MKLKFWLGWRGSERERNQLLDAIAATTTIGAHTEEGGRASGKDTMARPRYQEGSCVERRGKHGKVLLLRWREDVLQPDGTLKRIQRAETVRDARTKQKAKAILQVRVSAANLGQRRPQAVMKLSDFVGAQWKPNAGLALKKSSVRYYIVFSSTDTFCRSSVQCNSAN